MSLSWFCINSDALDSILCVTSRSVSRNLWTQLTRHVSVPESNRDPGLLVMQVSQHVLVNWDTIVCKKIQVEKERQILDKALKR